MSHLRAQWGLLVLLLASAALLPAEVAFGQGCATNAITAENCLAGNPSGEWDVSGAGDTTIQGFATEISVNRGSTVSFKVATNATSYRFDIYRLGYYGGMGARKVATVTPSAALPQNQPACLSSAETGLIDCGNWQVSGSWAVPSSAVSGIYFAKVVRNDTGGASHIVFIVRNDSGTSKILFKTSDTTWQAYNDYGGNSLYAGSPAGRAYKVSYNRPFVTRGNSYARAWLFGAEYPMVRWLEANGYDVSYFTSVDADRSPAQILDHEIFLSVGHDEYWSDGMRTNVEAARNAGVHLAFFSGNEIFWKTRWENSIDGSGTSYRTLVSYKETHANAKIDPDARWTGTWRDPRFTPPADGNRPENALSGQIFMVNCCDASSPGIKVPANEGKLRLWRNTSVATLASGQTATLAAGTLGYEWDEDLDNGFRPPGLFRLSSTPISNASRLQDYGSDYASGSATHSLTMYRHSSGALVFGAGTIRWSWGLDVNHDFDFATPGSATTPDVRMQQATVNLFADMGVQPGNLQPGLVATSQTTDTVAPVSVISSPAAGATVRAGQLVTISGTATDSGGGHTAGIEVSVDNGATWHPASGRWNWSYAWTPPSPAGSTTIRVRAVDDSGNLRSTTTNRTITVGPQVCPCSVWNSSAVPAVPSTTDPGAVELGVKFRATVNGTITAIRFYKGSGNTGTHIGSLWTTSGQRLGSATFTNETATGWQQVNFATPIAITANTDYVASYFAPNGRYAADRAFFRNSGINRGILQVPQDGVSGGNGVYTYGAASAFPTSTFDSSNYWVDVVFTTSAPVTKPSVIARSPATGATGVSVTTTVSARFNKPMNASTITSSTFQLRSAAGVIPATISYNTSTFRATLTPTTALAPGTKFTATVRGGTTDPRVKDGAGNSMAANVSWSFTTAN
ncbi:MAG TPA: N,N-dimethylformamidase beta subunit family domain-containing protein [Povalibacter sp.]